MKLDKIEIHSYRSIVNQTIKINNNCICLIGLNESGKSNILNAIRLLDTAFLSGNKDRSKINDELPKARYIFNIEEFEKVEISELIKSSLEIISGLPNLKFISHFNLINYNVTKYISKEKETYKRFKNHSAIFELEILNDFLKQKENVVIPPEISIQVNENSSPLAQIKIIHKDSLPENTIEFFEALDIDYLKKEIDKIVVSYLDKKIPEVIYWEYDKKYLLPSEMTYDTFIANNDPYSNSAPLHNIFLLSKRLGIKTSADLIAIIEEWKTDSSRRRKDSHILTEDINKYIKGIWNDYDQLLNIELEELKITIHINDPNSSISNYYEMEARSQGFKTFISFILTIAAEAESNLISNFILILDEPETHLHPSGVRFMKEELIKLSNSNYVFYATHSIFMIDRINLNRHIIVKKDKEITKLIPVDRNNIMQESVIYEALGTSVDEFSINNKNIVFEGDMDLILFQSFIELCVSKRENNFSDYDFLNGGGTKNIYTFFKDKMIPYESKWILILDNDSPGRNLKNDIEKYDSKLNEKITYYYYSSKLDYELEDLLPSEFILLSVKNTVSKLELTLSFELTIVEDRCISSLINEFKNRNKIEKDSNFEEIFKNELIEIIKLNLEQISKESSFEKKRLAFNRIFPEYYNFIVPLLHAYGIVINK